MSQSMPPVNVLPLTILFSSLLAVFFIVAFVMEWRRGARTSVERESLLPLDDGGEAEAFRGRGRGLEGGIGRDS